MKNNSNLRAIIMGFNNFLNEGRLQDLKYAEKDAEDFYDLMVDPRYGKYPSKNITLVTCNKIKMELEPGKEYPDIIHKLVNGDISSQEIRKDDIETILFTQAVRDCTEDDIILVYYSGHGFIAGKQEQAYLATPDTSILDIQSNPRAGVQMEYLHNEIFLESNAKFVIFLLDCCHSGAFCAGLENREQSNPKHLVEASFYSGEGRVAFVSCPKGVVSRESSEFQNGIFTHHLLNGLRGSAAEESGEVTVSSLISYVQRMSPISQPAISYGNFTRIVLTEKPKDMNSENTIYEVLPSFKLNINFEDSSNFAKIQPLTNPLDAQVSYINTIMRCISDISLDDMDKGSEKTIGNEIIDSICRSLDAEYTFLLRIEENESFPNIVYKYHSELYNKGFPLDDYRSLVMGDMFPYLNQKKKELLPAKYGFYKPFEGMKTGNKFLLAVPLRLEYPREYVLVCGVDYDKIKTGEIVGRIIQSVYSATGELTSLSVDNIETTILDDLKRDFGHVPFHIYQKRLLLFKNKLQAIDFYFEPIVLLRKKRPVIHSWEALARDLDTNRAPFSLFYAAELWGTQFITELDVFCLKKAVEKYVYLWDSEHPDRKFDPLSVNVYPQSLFRSSYKSQVYETIQQEDISDCLILELSEKRPIPTNEKVSEFFDSAYDPVEELIKEIIDINRNFSVRFAIDDFGVGYSSIARLAKLELDHIKIDRDVLLHSHPEETIKYVKNLVTLSHSHPFTIIAEGFDGYSSLCLRDLFDLGINHVQGHMIRRAGPNVNDLTKEEKKFIVEQLAFPPRIH